MTWLLNLIDSDAIAAQIVAACAALVFLGFFFTVKRLESKHERLDVDAGALEGDLTDYVKNELNEGLGPRR